MGDGEALARGLPVSEAIRQKIITIARSQLGFDDPRPYWREVLPAGTPEPYPPAWCGGFALAILKRAGLAKDVVWRIGRGFSTRLQATLDPQPGDLGYVEAGQHYAIVVHADRGSVRSIDGNGPGRQVVERVRARSDYAAFFTIAPLLGEAPPAPPSPVGSPSNPPAGPEARLLRGLDVSAYQSPTALDYSRAKAMGFSFVIARGVRMGREIDRTAARHLERARAAGLKVGIYAFFHPDEPTAKQIQLTKDAADLCQIREGDIVPALDLESIDKGPQANANWVAPATEILEAIAERFGTALRYHNLADWIAMGSPRWRHPLWLAAYRSAAPETAGPWTIWQYASSLVPGLSMVLDQNYSRELPLVVEARRGPPLPGPAPAFNLETTTRAALAATAAGARALAHEARDEHIATATDGGAYDNDRP